MSGRSPSLRFSFALICLVFAVAPASAAPPEVADLEFAGPDTIGWTPMPAAGYHVYRGGLIAPLECRGRDAEGEATLGPGTVEQLPHLRGRVVCSSMNWRASSPVTVDRPASM